MENFKLKTPVAFFVFNRPETTKRVFQEIARAEPTKLLLIADGPRPQHPTDSSRCQLVREIVEQVSWDCEVKRNFSVENLGCRGRMSSGLDWVFREVPEAIILEDDCLPDPSFFRFTQELLERYRDQPNLMMIGGTNFQRGRQVSGDSYYFSRFTHIWGWASWRRAWQAHYDVAMKKWPEFHERKGLEQIFRDPKTVQYWTKIFAQMYRGEIDTWDYQLLFANFYHGMLAATPAKNLVSNIGFGPGATHTFEVDNHQANAARHALDFPLRHPQQLFANEAADDFVQKTCFSQTLQERVKAKLSNFFRTLQKP